LPVPVFQGFAHAYLALALVVVPRVVHEADTAVYGRANQADALVIRKLRLADMEAPEANRRDALAGSAQRPVQHSIRALLLRVAGSAESRDRSHHDGSFQKGTAFHVSSSALRLPA